MHLPDKKLPLPGTLFEVDGRPAFVIPSHRPHPQGPAPWVWYAPTLPTLPREDEEQWMFAQFQNAGIGIAGIDVDDTYGSPAACTGFSAFHRAMVEKRGFSPRPGLLARSRGGLMHYNWAIAHPTSVACIAGIYPVLDLQSFPGLDTAANAYRLSKSDLVANLTAYNPIERVEILAKHRIPILHLHGDRDEVVPLAANSAELQRRLRKSGADMGLIVCEGQGHSHWTGWFHNQQLVDFMITHVLRAPRLVSE